jgi:hypothetical protein
MYTTDQRTFIVKRYIRKRIFAKCRERFIRKYPDSPVPTVSCVSKRIKKWRTTAPVLDETRHRKKTVLTDEKLEDIRALLEISPRKSLRWFSQKTGVSIGCASKATKLTKFRPYRIRVVHAFKPVDAPQRIRFCNWMLKNMHDGLVDPQLLFITDEAYFHLSGYVNSQSTRIWSDDNPHEVQQILLLDIKIGVWCAVSVKRIIGSIFYHETVISNRYVRNILEPFFEQLTDDERQYGYCACSTPFNECTTRGVRWQGH